MATISIHPARHGARTVKLSLLGAAAVILMASSASAATTDPDYLVYDGGAALLSSLDAGAPGPASPSQGLGFQGITQYDAASFNRNFIPPDTMGAVGSSQFFETANGAYAVYSKSGALLAKMSDVAFWAAAGQTGANGDSRVLFDARSQRWVVESFGASLSTIQIAVSDTSNALGAWKSTSFTGFAGGIADYPTLAIDNKAVYIGTNDFSGAQGNPYAGTTLNVINRNDLFGSAAPNVSSLKQFVTAYPGPDNGYAIQGVNQVGNNDAGQIVAVAGQDYGLIHYTINNPGTSLATQSAAVTLDDTPYDTNVGARQPDGTRNIDTLDDRVSSTVWELNGKIYAVHTITPTGTDHTEVQWSVIDAKTDAVIQEGVIGGNGDGFDYYQGSIAVNSYGQVVIGYNRSGFGTDGNVSIFADTFNPIKGGNGAIALNKSILIYVSPIGDYHNGATEFNPAFGRQRWGDYSQVSVDPTNAESFWVIGEYADSYNSPAFGHPTGSGGSRWGTWISDINLSGVPEPTTWAMMLFGLGGLGAALRRSRGARTAVKA